MRRGAAGFVLLVLLLQASPARANLGPVELGPADPALASRPSPRQTETTGKALPIRPGLRVEWLALRGFGGFAYYPAFGPNALGGGELVLVTLVWRHFYWELVRVAAVYPYLYNVGTAFGIPIRLDRAGDRQLRLGVHVTFPGPGLWSNAPVASGLQLHYHRRVSRRFAWHIGLMQFSYPGISVCFSLGIGF